MKFSFRKGLLLATILVISQFSAKCQNDAEIRQRLEHIYSEDQRYRVILDSLVRKEKLQWNDPKIQQWIPIAAHADSINLQHVISILDQYGWPGIAKVGARANEAIFLVIQHADSSVITHYFPLLVQSYELGQTPGKFYAMMLDRILVERGQKQIYGTQLKMPDAKGKMQPFDIEDEQNVDARRKKVGLVKLSEYLNSANNGNQ